MLQCKGNIRAGKIWTSWLILLVSAWEALQLGDTGCLFPSECIFSQKMTETIVAIMGLKGEKTWKWRGPKSRLCPGLDGTKYGLEQLIEAIAVRGLSLQYLGSKIQKILKQLGKVPVPCLRLVLAVSCSSSDAGAILCVRFLLGGCEGRSYWTASLLTSLYSCIFLFLS